MRLDYLALPFRIEQIGKTFRRLVALHHFGIVGHHAQRRSHRGIEAVGVAVLRRNVFRDIFRHVGCQHALTLPGQKLGRIAGAHRVRNMQAGSIFLSHPRKDTLAAGSLNSRVNSGKFLLERLADLLGKLKIGRRIPSKLAFLGRRRDQRRCYCRRRRWRCAQRRRINKRQRRCGFQKVSA
jgi:hypothetical protein